MCVIIASKIKLKNSDKENWFLYKIRDRAYSPEYKIKYSGKDKVKSAYVIDNDSDWSEGINSKGIMIVNAALQNHEDKKDGTSKGKSVSSGKVSRNGVIIRTALKEEKLDDVVKVLVDAKFDGCTLVSDGDRLVIVEIFLQQKTKDKILADLEIDPIEDEVDVKKLLIKNIKPEDYDVDVKEIKKDTLIVRTNTGILLPDAGYQPKDDIGYDSAIHRRDTVIKTIEDLEPNHPFDVLTAIKNLGSKEVHKDDIMRPIRTMPASPYQSTSIFLLTPTGSMYVVPLNCTFEDTSFNRVSKDRDVHVVILPKKLPLFESIHYKKLTPKETKMNFRQMLEASVTPNAVMLYLKRLAKYLKAEDFAVSEVSLQKAWTVTFKNSPLFKENLILAFKNIEGKKLGEANLIGYGFVNDEFHMVPDYILSLKDFKAKHTVVSTLKGVSKTLKFLAVNDIVSKVSIDSNLDIGTEFPEEEPVTESDDKDYDEYFQGMLKKWKISSPSELSDEDKKKFYDEVDAGWKGKAEKPETNEASETFIGKLKGK